MSPSLIVLLWVCGAVANIAIVLRSAYSVSLLGLLVIMISVPTTPLLLCFALCSWMDEIKVWRRK